MVGSYGTSPVPSGTAGGNAKNEEQSRASAVGTVYGTTQPLDPSGLSKNLVWLMAETGREKMAIVSPSSMRLTGVGPEKVASRK
jgi:hypothetical protein